MLFVKLKEISSRGFNVRYKKSQRIIMAILVVIIIAAMVLGIVAVALK